MIATKTTALILVMTTSLFAATQAAFAQIEAQPEPEICPGQPWFVLCPANIADASIVDPDANSVTNTAVTSGGGHISQTGTANDDDTHTITQDQNLTPTQTQTGNTISGNLLSGLLGTAP